MLWVYETLILEVIFVTHSEDSSDKTNDRGLENIHTTGNSWHDTAVSHPEEIWGQRFQLGVWSNSLNTSKILLIHIILYISSHFF